MTSKPTQQQRVLAVLQSLHGQHDIPEEYIRRHPTGDGVSVRYFKRVLWITECNGRISELRGKGYNIQSSSERDAYGFVYLRLEKEPAPTQLNLVRLPLAVNAALNSLADHKSHPSIVRPVNNFTAPIDH